MPTVLDWSPAVDPSELLRVVREAIAAGSPVVLPGDCGYVVLVNPAGLSAAILLESLFARRQSIPSVLAWSPDDPRGLGLNIPLAVDRLLTRGWPSPLVIEVPGEPDWPANWPQDVRRLVHHAGLVRFRCPEHDIFDIVAPGLEVPVLVVDTYLANVTSTLDCVDVSEAVAVNLGRLPIDGKPTVIRVAVNGSKLDWHLVEQGLLVVDEVEKLASRIILFVCTGNTCRSPLAEALAKKLLADHLGCDVQDLPRHGYWIVSAGISASSGSPAAEESVIVAAEMGGDLKEHQSRPVHPQLLAAADEVVTMTRSHASSLSSRYPGLGPVPTLLCGEEDLEDPIGAGLDVYRDCASTILVHLKRLLPAWVGS